MDPRQTFNQPRGVCNSSETSVMLQPAAPPPGFQDNPAGFPTSFPSHPAPQGRSAQGSYEGQSVVAVQPAVFVPSSPVPLANPAPEYTCYSIFTMLCCCLPLGIAALVYSLSTRTANATGQRREAARNSQIALILNHLTIAVGIIVFGAYLLNKFYLSEPTKPPEESFHSSYELCS